ncbi:MAG: flippase-like domain-containing protein [Prolixibacteraceae bacterium]|nr:flippase-like domain-containing protein [Prolixibacteraceae bacterium]MBT6007487.1 flippase-like domain-containing protein [Prolixibacteraceae bacterium]MBT6764093.1 flippase-like domain-containing protein [Prolixibacteraceae bacterium]MBT6997309.1 flippase-like domain-containing protein [Prolixibacteraceae bacterium]MBT7395668.1 flippase-like domain-containing protein [Prolixibacteraceae bacterium]
MKKIAIKVVKFISFFALGAFIFWLIYKDQDIDRIKSVLKNDVNYFWIAISLIIGLLSHVSRTMRWGLMIEPIGHKPRITNTFLAVMVGYLMNMVFPRMGEISRCGVLSRYEKISFTKLVGTVVAERVVDMISLLILLAIVFFSQFGKMLNFINQNPEIQGKLNSAITSPYLIVGVIIVVVLFIIFRRAFKHTIIFKKIIEILKNFKEGFISIRSIKRKGWFYFHSVFIWFLYYLMLYSVFFAFDFTRGLNPIAGLTTFVMASFGMVAPVQGGIGAWHFMAIEALSLYGVANENGIIFAFVSHTSTTGMIIIIGIISMLILPFINRRKDVKKEKESL